MMPRSQNKGRASERVAIVDETLCVSCGICAGSCAPMAIGPPDRSGRMQLKVLQTRFAAQPVQAGQVAVLVCGYNELCHDAQLTQRHDIALISTDCSGAVHTSVIEQVLRLGAKGVFIVSCPSRNCLNREGPKWLFERVYNDREAELPRRVDRTRIALINAASGERRLVLRALDAFCERLSLGAGTTSSPAGSQGPSEHHRPAVLTYLGTLLPRLVVTVLFLALLTVGNRTPVGHAGSDGVLRLAWRLPGEKIETCRDVTEAELATKPLHMRQLRECSAQPLSYRLVLTIGGEMLLDQTIAPAGARGDRPLYIQRDMRLAVGSYLIDVDFMPILPVSETRDAAEVAMADKGGAPPRPHRHLVLHASVQIAPDQITLIDYDDHAEALIVVGRGQ